MPYVPLRNDGTIDYNWINQLSNTTVWWLDICCLLHRYQLHVSALLWHASCVWWRGVGVGWGTRSRVC